MPDFSQNHDSAELPDFPNMTIVRKLGEGAFASVYEAVHHLLQKNVAVKVLKSVEPSFQGGRFQREARAMSSLQHPNIVRVYSCSLTPSAGALLVMEFIEGQSLEKYVQVQGKLSSSDSCNIAIQLSRALKYMHDMGIIHRDIKPGNIMMADENTPKLLDFGLAKLKSSGPEQKLTTTTQLMGTPAFMSPEQCAGKEANALSDQYSLACVLYFMLTGKTIFVGESQLSIMLAHLSQTVSLSRSLVPQGLRLVLSKALAKDPSQRYADCAAFEKALEISNSNSVAKTPVACLPVALALCLIAILALAFLIFTKQGNEIVISQIEEHCTRADAVKSLSGIVSTLLEIQQKDSATDLALLSVNMPVFRNWSLADKNKLLTNYISSFRASGMEDCGLDFNLMQLDLILTFMEKQTKLSSSDLDLEDSVCTDLAKKQHSRKDWLKISRVLDKFDRYMKHPDRFATNVLLLKYEAAKFLRSASEDSAIQTTTICLRLLEQAEARGKYDLVYKIAPQAIVLAAKHGLRENEALFHFLVGRVYLHQGNLEKARQELASIEPLLELGSLSSSSQRHLNGFRKSCGLGAAAQTYEPSNPSDPDDDNEHWVPSEVLKTLGGLPKER